ncbi:MAG: hypothetical protein K8I27_03595 [Planctomycetes bacterium]|nr:hypothetical protein [Planctomycetota bacterium]
MTDEKHEEPEAESGASPDSRRRIILWGSIGAGALLGLVFALAMPADWLFVPQELNPAQVDGVAQGTKNPKEFYA